MQQPELILQCFRFKCQRKYHDPCRASTVRMIFAIVSTSCIHAGTELADMGATQDFWLNCMKMTLDARSEYQTQVLNSQNSTGSRLQQIDSANFLSFFFFLFFV